MGRSMGILRKMINIRIISQIKQMPNNEKGLHRLFRFVVTFNSNTPTMTPRLSSTFRSLVDDLSERDRERNERQRATFHTNSSLLDIIFCLE